MVDWRTLTDFQRDLLEVILDEADYEAPQSGQQLKTALEPYRGAAVNHGRLYPNLDTLVEYGLVDVESLDGRTNGYTPTEAGIGLYCERDERTSEIAAQYDRQPVVADGGEAEMRSGPMQDLSIGPGSGEPDATRNKQLGWRVGSVGRQIVLKQDAFDPEAEMYTATVNGKLSPEAATELRDALDAELESMGDGQ